MYLIKKSLSLLVCAAFCLALLPAFASAAEDAAVEPEDPAPVAADEAPVPVPNGAGLIAEGECGDGFTWTLTEDRLLTVSGAGELDAGIDWEALLADAAAGIADVRRLVIEPGVTGVSSFANFENLSAVSLPDGLISIGLGAFSGCSALEGIAIPASVRFIGDYAFYGCTALSGVYISDLPSWCEIEFGISEFGTSEANPLRYAHTLYLNGTPVTSLVLPSSLTAVRGYAFDGCDIASVVIPEGIVSIGAGAFLGCTGLTEIILPEGVTSIGARAFESCAALASVSLPDSLTALGQKAFYGCSSLTEITIPGGVQKIGVSTFDGCTALTDAVLCDGVEQIGDYAFVRCNHLVSVVLPASLNDVGYAAFNRCAWLRDVYYGGTAEQWGLIHISSLNVRLKNAQIHCEPAKDMFSVLFDANGGEGAPEAQLKLRGVDLTLSSAEPVRVGYVFLGWASDPEAATAVYLPGGVYTGEADITLYAVWSELKPEPPSVVMAEDGRSALVTGSFDALYARVALALLNAGESGLYVAQAAIEPDGTVSVPVLDLPGLTLTGVSVALVETPDDVTSPTPDIIDMDYIFF